MRRLVCPPRQGWQDLVVEQGLTWHTHDDGSRYWSEGIYYEFSEREIEAIEEATAELHRMMLDAAGHVIRNRRWDLVGLPSEVGPAIEASWEHRDMSLYGRFDLIWTGHGVKLLEYNADTPTSLREAALVQWAWFEDVFSDERAGNRFDQFNSLHEKLLERLRKLRPANLFHREDPTLHFATLDDEEDVSTAHYLLDLAGQAGWKTRHVLMEQLGRHDQGRYFVDDENTRIRRLFKLYPWENLMNEMGTWLNEEPMRQQTWLEPTWKAVLSSKGLLAVAWERNEGHPSLLETVLATEGLSGDHVVKPFFSREGANVTIHRSSHPTLSTPGPYGGPAIAQRFQPAIDFDGHWPVIGSWLVGDSPAGMGIRESRQLVTDNRSAFVPHVIFG